MRRFLLRSVAVASVLASLPAYAQTRAGFGAPEYTNFRPSVSTGFKPWGEWWAGFGWQNSAYGGYAGGNFALNSQRNVWDDGPVLRWETAAGHYHYPSGAVASGDVNATFHAGALMFGYRKRVGEGLLSGYVGVNYQHDDTNDPTAKIQGTKAGVKVIGEYYSSFGPIFDFWGQASYSSVWDSFSIAARPGMAVAKDLRNGFVKDIRVGPDVGYFSNNAPYRQYQVGAFAQFTMPDAISSFTIAGGYRDPTTPGPSGYYANIGLYHPF